MRDLKEAATSKIQSQTFIVELKNAAAKA